MLLNPPHIMFGLYNTQATAALVAAAPMEPKVSLESTFTSRDPADKSAGQTSTAIAPQRIECNVVVEHVNQPSHSQGIQYFRNISWCHVETSNKHQSNIHR